MELEQYFKRYMRDFAPEDPQQWNYTAGCVLLGAQDLFEATQDEEYLRLPDRFARDFVDENGVILGYDPTEHNVDLMCSARIFFPLLARTGEQRFRRGMQYVYEDLMQQPRTKEGSFWHKQRYPNQVWLDGLYMAQPFYVAYESAFCANRNIEDTMRQFETVRRCLYEPAAGLYYHGYDETRTMYWADGQTGCSASFWLRGMGWYLMALTDCFEAMPERLAAQRARLAQLLEEAAFGLVRYRDKNTGMFFQVVDRPELQGNYPEASGSCMAAYALMKGYRLHMLHDRWLQTCGKAVLEGTMEHCLRVRSGRIALTNVCASAGLGDFQGRRRDGTPAYYVAERRVNDNAHGVAALMMAYAEYLRAE